MAVECVDRLAGLVGVSGRQGGRFDWAAVEASLGLVLPVDYKALVETFPDGRFQGFVRPIRPEVTDEGGQEFLGFHAYRLEDMRRWRLDEPDRFPLPIFPEPGGLLPWATTHRGEQVFWLTEAGDPNAWPIVITDHEFAFWQHFGGTVCELLTEVVCGRFDASRFEVDLASRDPWFELTPSMESAATMPPRELYWIDAYRLSERLGGPVSPVNEFPTLAEALGPGRAEVRPVDWARAEERIGLPLPSDYKAFIDAYGPGTCCDIVIAAPGAAGEFDLFDLLERKHRQFGRNEQASFYPDLGGAVAWGETVDGWGCFWATTGPDPDQWGTVVVGPEFGGAEIHWDMSFSSLLLNYPERPGLFYGRDVRRGPLSFTPYRRPRL